jgi:hypothetical protein
MSKSTRKQSLSKKSANNKRHEETNEEHLFNFPDPFLTIENKFKEISNEIENETKRIRRSIFPESGNMFQSIMKPTTTPLNRKNVDKLFTEFEETPRSSFPGTCISQSHVSSRKIKDGKEESENYKSQSISQIDKKGKKITERQQAYKNSEGVDKISHERILGNKGHKIVKARHRENQRAYEHNYFKGLTKDDLEKFNKEYNQHKEKVEFDKNFSLLESLPSGSNFLGSKKHKALEPEQKSQSKSRKR